jgi:uncharacterized phiE125 gp8 family phage protein
MNLVRTSLPAQPSGLVITLTEAKAHLRVTSTQEDADIISKLAEAQGAVEDLLGRALSSQGFRLSLDAFPSDYIELPRPPLIAISSVKYYDENDALQTLASSGYVLDSDAEPARIYPSDDGWPTTSTTVHPAVLVEYTCGHTTTRPAEPQVVSVVKLLLGYAYENREAVIVGSAITELPFIQAYLRSQRVRGRFAQ